MRSDFRHGDRVVSYLDAAGPGPSAPGQTVVLLHAFPVAAETWRPQLEAVPAGWRFIAPDLRGFGQSEVGDPAAPASMEGYARDVVGLLDHLCLDRVVVGGLSMGGYVAFALQRLAPERLAGLVLADTRAEADDETARANRDRMAETLAQGGLVPAVESMVAHLLGPTSLRSRPDVVRRVRELVLAQPLGAIYRALRSMKSRPDSTSLLAGITCPTLVVVGAEDLITKVEIARDMHARIPGAELAVIEEAGHLSNLEQPVAFNAALAAFLMRVACR